MIYTLTANPAIDYNIACDGLAANTVTRTRNAVYTPNGKGLNVSFTLDHYGVDTTILGFFAGFSGEFIVKGAEALGVPVKPVWTDGITRVNVFLNAGPDTEYNMVNAGAAINEANEQVAMFNAMYEEYSNDPEITRSRMYYETIREVLPDVKVYIDMSEGGVETLLPLESFVQEGSDQ